MKQQRKVYFCFSIALSFLLFYAFYPRLEGKDLDQFLSTLNLDHVVHNSKPETDNVVPGQVSYLLLTNGTRVRDNLYDVQNETLGVSTEFLSPNDVRWADIVCE